MNDTLINPLKGKIVSGVEENGKISIYVSRINGPAVFVKTVSLDVWELEKTKKMSNGYTVSGTIENSDAKQYSHPVLEYLAKKSRQFTEGKFKNNIRLTNDDIGKAEELLEKMAAMTDIAEFNQKLLDYFSLIPRAYKNFVLESAANPSMIKDVVAREHDLLMNFQTSVCGEEDISDIYFEDVPAKEKESVASLLKIQFKELYRAGTHSQDSVFDAQGKKVSLLFHGSRTENWYSIIKTGLNIDPVNVITTGKMFGRGIYFAPSLKKASNYSSKSGSVWTGGTEKEGFVGIYEVVTGDPYESQDWIPSYTSLTKAPKGKDCFWARGGKALLHDEVIIYNSEKCRLKYLMKI